MKNEDAFNAYLSKEIGKLAPSVAKLKMAEKYHIGIPDFCLWKDGRSVVFESKFIHTVGLPASKGSVLKHPFTGPQQTFMQTLMRAGVPAFGVIGIDDLKQAILVPANFIPVSGSWSISGFINVLECTPIFPMCDVDVLVNFMFSYEVIDGVCRRNQVQKQS